MSKISRDELNSSIIEELDSVANIVSGIDNGRYQSEFGLDGAEYLNATLSNESVVLDNVPGATVSRTQDANSSSRTGKCGLKFSTNVGYTPTSLRCVLSANTSGATKAYILDSSKAVLATLDITGKTPGQSFEINYNMLANTTYYVCVDNDSSSFTCGEKNGEIYPINSTDLNITGGLIIGSDNATYSFAILSIIPLYKTTSGTVKKSYTPNLLNAWGNIKWIQNNPANTNIVCDILTPYIADSRVVINSIYGSAYGGNRLYGGKFVANAPSLGQVNVTVSVRKYGTIASPLQVHIYKTANGLPTTSIGSANIAAANISTSDVLKTVTITLSESLTLGTTYFVVLTTANGDSSNCYGWDIASNALDGNSYRNLDGTWVLNNNSWSYYFSVENVTPLKSNVTSITDLSDISIATYKSLIARWILSRNGVNDSSPSVNSPSLTWEGNDNNEEWVQIGKVTLTSAAVRIDFNNIPDYYRFFKLDANVKALANSPIMRLTFNNGTSDYYKWLRMYCNGGSTAPGLGGDYMKAYMEIATIMSTDFVNVKMEIRQPAIDKKKSIIVENWYDNNTVSNYPSSMDFRSGYWNVTNIAINSINLVASSDSFDVGSTFVLYGRK